MIETGLPTFLQSIPLVEQLVAARIYPLVIPQTAQRPAICYQRISTPRRAKAHDGRMGMATARMQLTIEGRSYAEAVSLSAAVVSALIGYRGMMGAVKVFETDVANELDGFSLAVSADLAPVRRVEILISYCE